MEQSAQVFAAIFFLVIGLSHLMQPKVWVAFFQTLAARGLPGAFLDGFFYLAFGALIVAFHNVWHGPGLVLTLIGWAQVLKGAGRLLAPQIGLRALESVSPERTWHFQVGGV